MIGINSYLILDFKTRRDTIQTMKIKFWNTTILTKYALVTGFLTDWACYAANGEI